jgi:hypothetical protein
MAEAGGAREMSEKEGEEVVLAPEDSDAAIAAEGLNRILDQRVRDHSDDLLEECGMLTHGLSLLGSSVEGLVWSFPSYLRAKRTQAIFFSPITSTPNSFCSFWLRFA